MPPPDRAKPGSPSDWIARARGDLALARAPLPEGGFYEDLCFHAQQAAEKALKAVYLHHGWLFRYVHDLEELVSGLERQGLAVPEDVKECLVLTTFASEMRYPHLSEPVTEAELRAAADLAERAICWAEAATRDRAP